MPYIIIDTEGTGLFETKTRPDGSVPRSDEQHQPRMAEYAHVLADDKFNVESVYQDYILPVGWENPDGSPMLEMPEGPLSVHGLTMEFLTIHGSPVERVLNDYLKAVPGRAFIGFNQQHDGRQIRGELRRAGLPDEFENTPSICAMRSLQAAKIKIRKLNGKGGFPRLIDAAAHFGVPGYEVERHHKALDDALACLHVAKCLAEMGKLLPAEVHYNKALERS
jgi:DNA polymerase III subunit epsilon